MKQHFDDVLPVVLNGRTTSHGSLAGVERDFFWADASNEPPDERVQLIDGNTYVLSCTCGRKIEIEKRLVGENPCLIRRPCPLCRSMVWKVVLTYEDSIEVRDTVQV